MNANDNFSKSIKSVDYMDAKQTEKNTTDKNGTDKNATTTLLKSQKEMKIRRMK